MVVVVVDFRGSPLVSIQTVKTSRGFHLHSHLLGMHTSPEGSHRGVGEMIWDTDQGSAVCMSLSDVGFIIWK